MYRKIATILTDMVIIDYRYESVDDLNEIERIISMYKIADLIGVGARLFDVISSDGSIIIKLEKIIAVDHGLPEGLTVIEAEKLLHSAVQTLHNHGYGHGDLGISNLGFRLTSPEKYQGIIIDLDTAYHLTTGKDDPRVKKLMDNIGFNGDYQDFIDYDYTKWCDESPIFDELYDT